jgi:K+-sensing histidine kinase KdpD
MTDPSGFSNGRNNIEKSSRHAGAIETLLATGRSLAASSDIQAILEQIMTQVGPLLNPKAWSLLHRDEKTGKLQFAALLSGLTESLKVMGLPAGHGVAGCCCSDTGLSR